jgi:hypothetical protein
MVRYGDCREGRARPFGCREWAWRGESCEKCETWAREVKEGPTGWEANLSPLP